MELHILMIGGFARLIRPTRLYQSQHRFHGEVFCALRHDRGISVPGQQDVAVL